MEYLRSRRAAALRIARHYMLAMCVLFSATVPSVAQVAPEASFWPEWRGPLRSGVAPSADPPVTWSESSNVRWKMELPGRGSATPVIWEDRVFVPVAVPTEERARSGPNLFSRLATQFIGGTAATAVQQFVVLAVSRQDGRVLWMHVAREAVPHQGTHADGTWASASAVTDGEVVCASFGSMGIYCYDLDGRPLWATDLGNMRTKMGFGEGASPTLYRNLLIVPWDHEGQSFLTALDKHTGQERWRTPREETTSWSTPVVVQRKDGAEVVTSATGAVRGYDAATGVLRWWGEGMTANAIPTPVAAGGVVFVTSGYRGSRLAAIDLSVAVGDIRGSDAVVWSVDRDTPYVPSPLLADGQLYVLKGNSGVLTVYDAETGTRRYGPERVPGVRNVYASPVAAAGRLYVTSREGVTTVLGAHAPFDVLATNTLDDGFDASPAIVDGEIYLRGNKFLYSIATD